jgi:hypothetical protein
MGFLCPACHTTGSLQITKRLELPPDSRSDEITLQIVRCQLCEFMGIAIYEESRRGALEDESIDHRGYYVSASDLQRLKKLLRECPKPGNSSCTCAAHRQLGGRDKSGRWAGLVGFELNRRFEMIYG